jgi:branched-chain amino acid transport system ATP-binding protein
MAGLDGCRNQSAVAGRPAPLLEMVGVDAGYGLSRILFGVDLSVHEGEVVALLGRNGAGKSTTLKTVAGLTPPTAGRVRFSGREISGKPSYLIARAGVGYVPQDRRIFSDLTVRENLEVGRRRCLGGRTEWTTERVFGMFPALRELSSRRGDSLSGGEQQMLTVARTLMGNPKLLLLDEPSEGLAPILVRTMAEQVHRLKEEGLAILLSEQNLLFTRGVCDRAYVLEKGRIRHEGMMSDLVDDQNLLRKYLMV